MRASIEILYVKDVRNIKHVKVMVYVARMATPNEPWQQNQGSALMTANQGDPIYLYNCSGMIKFSREV